MYYSAYLVIYKLNNIKMNYYKLDWLFSENDLIISLPILLTLVFSPFIGLFLSLK